MNRGYKVRRRGSNSSPTNVNEKQMPNSIRTRAKNGTLVNFETKHSLLEQTGLHVGDRVKIEEREGWVIGVAENNIWFHLDGDVGPSYWNTMILNGSINQNFLRKIELLYTAVMEPVINPTPIHKLLTAELRGSSDVVLETDVYEKSYKIPSHFFNDKTNCYCFHLHKAILAAHCEYFKTLFYGPFATSNPVSVQLILNQVKSDSEDELVYFWEFVDLVYSETFRSDLSLIGLFYVYYYANYFQYEGIHKVAQKIDSKRTVSFLKEEVMPLFSFGELLGWESYLGSCLMSIIETNLSEWFAGNESDPDEWCMSLKEFPKLQAALLSKCIKSIISTKNRQ